MKYILCLILINLILLTVVGVIILFFIYKKKYCYNNLKYPFPEPSFVISIHPNRYTDFKNRLKQWNSHINLYNGVIGIKLKREKLISDGILDKDSDLTLGQIGCWLSHYNLWKKIKDEKISYMTIFEDDVNIDVSYNTIKLVNTSMKELKDNKIKWDVIYLGSIRRHRKINGKNKILPHWSIPVRSCGTFFYNISYKGACKLLNKAMPIKKRPVDNFIMDMNNKKKLNVLHLNPSLCYVVPVISSTSLKK